LQTPTFDAIGEGVSGSNVTTSLTFTHNAEAGADVYLAITLATASSAAIGSITYGGIPFSIGLGEVGSNSTADIIWFRFTDAPGGEQEVEIPITSGTLSYITANTISYTGVSGVALVQAATGTGALTQEVDCASGQLIVQAFATASQPGILGGFSGGTERYFGDVVVSGVDHSGLVISDSSSSTTFGATNDNPTSSWASMALVLNPALSTVLAAGTGGVGGGSGGFFNPLNSNTTSAGLTPGNETWPTSGPGKRTFYGGPSTTSTHLPGNAPGGGSAGGDASFPPLNGADGAVYITARQS
jgi:hypothetical protein